MNLPDNFTSKFAVDHNGCWIWTASTRNEGYGCYWFRNKLWRAHRVSWTLLKGEIPEGMLVLHKCDIPQCVNPDHLEVVSFRENVLRGTQPTAINAMKTHCSNGHEFTPENTKFYRNRHTHRICIKCSIEKSIRLKEQRRADRAIAQSSG